MVLTVLYVVLFGVFDCSLYCLFCLCVLCVCASVLFACFYDRDSLNYKNEVRLSMFFLFFVSVVYSACVVLV